MQSAREAVISGIMCPTTHPYAVKLTGGSYGSHDNVYVEYMANSLCDTDDGGSCLYLDHNTFQHQNPPFQQGEIGVSNIMVCML